MQAAIKELDSSGHRHIDALRQGLWKHTVTSIQCKVGQRVSNVWTSKTAEN